MAPSLSQPMTSSPTATPSKRQPRRLPIIPAIPRSLEKKFFKEDVKYIKEHVGTTGQSRPISPEAQDESQAEIANAQAPAEQNETLNGLYAKDELQENGVHDAVVAASGDTSLNEEVATDEGKSTFRSTLVRPNKQTPKTSAVNGGNHVQDFGIEKHGFRLPPPFYPKHSPPPALSTDFSSENEKASASEATSHTLIGDDGSNMSQHSLAENHVSLNAAAPVFHAHPDPPTDVTNSPIESPDKGNDIAQSVPLQPEPIPPSDAIPSPVRPSFQNYEATQNISFYAPPQSPDNPPSPNHSVFQGYAYAPGSYGYSPQSHASQHPVDSPHRTEANGHPGQHYESLSCYTTQPPYPILGSQPPLTPSQTPLDPSAQPWSYPNGHSTMMSTDYGYMPCFYPQSIDQPRDGLTSPRILESDESARNAGFVDAESRPVQLNSYETETKAAPSIEASWRKMNECMSSPVPLVEHLLQQFNVEEYADCRLTLVHENLRFEKTTWSLSSLLLAQSRKLRDLLNTAGPSEEGKRHLEIRLTDRFITPWAMNSVLRVLYGERPQMSTLTMITSAFDANAEPWTVQMDGCLAFAAAGHVLGLEDVALHGLQIASLLLHWDNLEHALSFALESGPNRGTSASADVIPLSAYSPVWSRDSNPSPATNQSPPNSSTESKPERFGDEGVSSASSYTGDVRSARDLQTCCLQWMGSNLDDFWQFDPSARPLAEVDRLPTTAESRSPLFKSRLSRIQFGDHPSEMHAKANDRNALVSSIVLSLPFVALKYMLDLGIQPLLHQLHAIVEERERRRQLVLQSKSVPWSQRLAAREHAWAEVGYTEWVETTGDGKVSLARTFTGIDRQVSEPSTPGQQKRRH